jgi:hypothetical protein
VPTLEMPLRPRRNRRSPTVRAAFREVRTRPAHRSCRAPHTRTRTSCTCTTRAARQQRQRARQLTPHADPHTRSRVFLRRRRTSRRPTSCCRSSCTMARTTSPSAPCPAAAASAGALPARLARHAAPRVPRHTRPNPDARAHGYRRAPLSAPPAPAGRRA